MTSEEVKAGRKQTAGLDRLGSRCRTDPLFASWERRTPTLAQPQLLYAADPGMGDAVGVKTPASETAAARKDPRRPGVALLVKLHCRLAEPNRICWCH
jgi:hypothetical protein